MKNNSQLYRISQTTPPLASNPGTAQSLGLNNMPLNDQSQGVTPEDMISKLENVVNGSYRNNEAIKSQLEELLLGIKDQNIKNKVSTLIESINMASDPRKRTKNIDRLYPENQYDPTPEEIAGDLIKLINRMDDSEPQMNTENIYNNKTAQKVIKKKKKTRGNPFRVLMGKVGKLLDHGVEKNDIVRYIAKENKWDNETIEKAVKIVQDYNRKKTRKSNDQNRIVTSAFDYTTKPDFEKRSTPELVFRVCYLLELDEYDKNTKQGHGKDADNKKGVKEEIKAIKAALENRGFDKEDMKKLGLGN